MIFEVSEGWKFIIFDVPKRRRGRRPRYGRSDRRKIVKKTILGAKKVPTPFDPRSGGVTVLQNVLLRLPGDHLGTHSGSYGRDFWDVF